jgi:hypothetical protein
MNRTEAIERALTAILVAGDVTRDTLEIAQKALAMPKSDAERVALVERIDSALNPNTLEPAGNTLHRDIRAYLKGGDA